MESLGQASSIHLNKFHFYVSIIACCRLLVFCTIKHVGRHLGSSLLTRALSQSLQSLFNFFNKGDTTLRR